MVRLNRVLHNGRQFIWVGDITSLELKFVSQQVTDFFGIESEKYDISQNLSRTHPLDLMRRSRARASIIETGQDLYVSKAGAHLTSCHFRIRNRDDKYINVLVQSYLFYSESPAETVYVLLVNTIVPGSLSKHTKKRLHHWYSGNDLT